MIIYDDNFCSEGTEKYLYRLAVLINIEETFMFKPTELIIKVLCNILSDSCVDILEFDWLRSKMNIQYRELNEFISQI